MLMIGYILYSSIVMVVRWRYYVGIWSVLIPFKLGNLNDLKNILTKIGV
jgi:hypothetical protein